MRSEGHVIEQHGKHQLRATFDLQWNHQVHQFLQRHLDSLLVALTQILCIVLKGNVYTKQKLRKFHSVIPTRDTNLPWLLKYKTFPVKTSSVPMCSNFPSAKRQCPSCNVKRHLNIWIVCNFSTLSHWNISKKYTYYIYILKHFISLSFEHYYLIHVSACAWARVGCCARSQGTSCFPNHLSNTFESSHWPMCLLPLKLLACAALADWSPSAITCQANKNTQEDTTDHITSSCWMLLWWCPSCLWPAIEYMRAQMLQQMFRCHISTMLP